MPIVNHRELVIRSITNAVAVCFFFMGVHYGSVTNANLLNMTYPAFVALLAPILIDEKLLPVDIWALILSLAGIFLITEPQNKAFSMGDLWGLASGIFAAWAIVSLRIVRKTDHTLTILTYVFGFGTLIFMPIPFLVALPRTKGALWYLLFSAVTGVLGQLTLTYGYRFVSALEGSIISSSRLIFAIIFGLILLDDNIGSFIITGGILILLSNILEAFRNQKKQ
jgi:drug/metabolite transporter (DMT)-like permease